LRYGVRRIIVLDFDLHHGNGTQSIAWSINAETQRQEEEKVSRAEAGLPPPKVGPKVYYGSLHDILSYPCEVSYPLRCVARKSSLISSIGWGCQSGSSGVYHAFWRPRAVHRKCAPRAIHFRRGLLLSPLPYLPRAPVRRRHSISETNG